MIEMSTVDKEGRVKTGSVILVPKDYVQIVRCENCNRCSFDYYDGNYPCYCDKWLHGVKFNDFCSYAERK